LPKDDERRVHQQLARPPGLTYVEPAAMTRDDVDEIVALWTEVFGEPPSLRTDIGLMVEILVGTLPPPAGRQWIGPSLAPPDLDELP
jgi:hypothetical protein